MALLPSSRSPLKNFRASRMLIPLTSGRLFPPTVTARLSGFRRCPPHSGQTSSTMYSSYICFIASDEVSRYRRSSVGMIPSNPVV